MSRQRVPRSVIVVGAGFGGLAAAIELTRHGYDEVTLLEAGDDLGGTWHWNTYPGAACDVPSHLYSFSFATRRDWSRLCPPRAEILGYLHEVARRFDVDHLVVTGQRVTSCRWDEADARWTVVAHEQGGRETTRTADVLVLATGQLDRPSYPSIPGRDSFAGPAFHTARWDHSVDLAGRRVAVVGTGATAVQVVPELAELVGPGGTGGGRTTVFQRSGSWLLPRQLRDLPGPVRGAFRHVPGLAAAWRWGWRWFIEVLTLAIRHPATAGRAMWLWSWLFMRLQLRDPDLRRRAWPDYAFGCKRVLFTSHYLPALARPDVDLVTEAITEITPRGLRTADGREHDADVIVWATGFRTDFDLPFTVVGREGRALSEAWSEAPRAHLGITVPDFPNLFLMYGPNTNTSGGSIVWFLEAQAGYVRRALDLAGDRDAEALVVRPEVAEASDRELQGRFAGTAWQQCSSWYADASGRIVTNWPGYMGQYAEATRHVRPEDFELVGGDPAPDAER